MSKVNITVQNAAVEGKNLEFHTQGGIIFFSRNRASGCNFLRILILNPNRDPFIEISKVTLTHQRDSRSLDSSSEFLKDNRHAPPVSRQLGGHRRKEGRIQHIPHYSIPTVEGYNEYIDSWY